MGLVSKKIFNKKMIPYGFKISDPARGKKQAIELAKSFPPDMPSIVVKTGKKGDVFPYSIYVREMFGDDDATKRLRKIYNK